MNKEIFSKIEEYHENDEHEKILEIILNIPKKQRDYEVIGLLARAYNNLEKYDLAIEELLSIKEKGENDSLWQMRMGYAYHFSNKFEEAMTFFEKCKKLNPKEKNIDLFLTLTRNNIECEEDENKKINFEKSSKERNFDYLSIFEHEDSISICLDAGNDKVMSVGERMNEINEEAYMNGYNWEAVFNYYLDKYNPEIKEEMNFDSEAGTFVAYYNNTPSNKIKTEKFELIIRDLIENEDKLYEFIKAEGENIEWD